MLIETTPGDIAWDTETRAVLIVAQILSATNDLGKFISAQDIVHECRACPFNEFCTSDIGELVKSYIAIQLPPDEFIKLKGNNSICGVINAESAQRINDLLNQNK